MQLSLRVIAQGPEIRATDSFILQIGNSAQNAPKAKKPAPIAKPIAKPAAKPVSAAPKPPRQISKPIDLFRLRR
jgi:hypothetical protein